MKTDNGLLVLNGGLVGCTSLTVTAGVLDLGGTTSAVTSVTLLGGSIVDGSLNVDSDLNLYSGTVSTDISGAATLNKLGPDTVFLAGSNSYTGGTNALGGTLIAAADSLPAAASGSGTVVVQPTLYWSGGTGDWTSGTVDARRWHSSLVDRRQQRRDWGRLEYQSDGHWPTCPM